MPFERMRIFDGRVEISFFGREYGDFGIKSPDGARLRGLMREALGLKKIFFPSVDFTNRVANVLDSDAHQAEPGIWRTKQKADGAIVVADSFTGLSICNADCPIGILFDPKSNTLCMVHLGLKCFYRSDGSDSILVEALRVMNVPLRERSRLVFWFGGGIGPCCYGFDLEHEDPKWRKHNRKQAKELQRLFGEDVVGGTTEFGPRAGQTSHDLYKMIHRHAESLWLKKISSDQACTSCAKDHSNNDLFWSNVKDADQVGYRNMLVAYISD